MKNKISILVLSLVSSILAPFHASAAERTIERVVEYKDGDKTYEGFLVMPARLTAKKTMAKNLPGILVIHNWMGVTEETKSKARALAQLGYVAFAADIYGKGIRPANTDEAGKLATLYKSNRPEYRKHLNLGLKQLTSIDGVNPSQLAVLGYCFGGTGAIELGRSGADVKGIVSFHGGLDSPDPSLGKNIKGRVIAFHGADDPYVPAKDLAAFEDEMRTHKIDWQLMKFGNAVHSFTDKGAGSDNSKGAAYNELADRRSWSEMKDFLKDLFENKK